MLNGFIVIDKPAGISSHAVVSKARRILSTRRIGHTGTLDPFATGVLPLAVNEGTKAIPFLDEGCKSYEAVMRLGVSTDTLDMTGEVLAENDWRTVTAEGLQKAFASHTGLISQIPPMYSALKRDGQPLYKLARAGKTVERPPRSVLISRLELVSFEPPFAGFKVECSKGTYIRSLADDVGNALGCGAALQELRRTASGPFTAALSVTLEQLELLAARGAVDTVSIGMNTALSHLPEAPLTEQGAHYVSHGRSPCKEDLDPAQIAGCGEGDLIRLVHQGKLLAVAGCRDSGSGAGIVIKRVFM